MASSEKRCLYEVLGLSRDCTADEIRSAYKRLALQRHPDKLVQSGVSEADATAAFQELVNAYEVLSDARERAWYDSHRTQILFSTSSASDGSSNLVPDLFSFFSNSVYSGYADSGKGFYKVYGDLFERIYGSELTFAKKLGLDLPREAPVLGNLESPYAQVTAFYNYWLGFATSMDFCWEDQYDVMAGPNRKSRRLMEEENKKLRRKARREFNETVRGLAEFVKKRDKRVIDMQLKRNEEMERKREEEKQRKKELERQKAERARNYTEPEWAKIEELDDEEAEDVDERKNELYCVACGKKFKTDKQWKNHEQSKKHKEKLAELKEAFSEEDREYIAAGENGKAKEENGDADGDGTGYLSADEGLNDLEEQFKVNVGIQEEETCNDDAEFSDATSFNDMDSGSGQKGASAQMESDDDEASFLQTMVSGRKSRNRVGNKPKSPVSRIEAEVQRDELEFMEYNDTKGSRRSKGGRRRRKDRSQDEEVETSTADASGKDFRAKEQNGPDDTSLVGESVSNTLPESETMNGGSVDTGERAQKHQQQAAGKKSTIKKENVSKSKFASRGRKQKDAAGGSGTACEKCGEEFETRNKLHKHLGETGHATLRSR
ncbi:DNAJ protein JJJ1 homolog [Henckelia pumila]|uniref:DNAJ protein JJJ1 homolog n=1 Tax=Henckelia pumila TaxID=405737 RepID=UPI003C6E73E5